MRNEEQIIKEIARRADGARSRTGSHSRAGLLRLGIGDDAAILAPRRGTDWVVSCDAFLEGVHFLGGATPADAVGWKTLVRATSDLAAMGAAPRLFFLTLALPPEKAGAWLEQFAGGISRAARRLGMRLAGGDTTANERVAISVTVMGEVERGKAVRRSGARAGDIIYVSGKLGRAELGLRILKGGMGGGRRDAALIRPHFYPEIRVELGKWLAARGVASAMMDISDGLSTDLARLCSASRIAANLYADRIPAVPLPRAIEQRYGLDRLTLALDGGEDYGLLFTIPKRFDSRIPKSFRGTPVTRIGEIVSGSGVRIVTPDGRISPLAPRGWDHFAHP